MIASYNRRSSVVFNPRPRVFGRLGGLGEEGGGGSDSGGDSGGSTGGDSGYSGGDFGGDYGGDFGSVSDAAAESSQAAADAAAAADQAAADANAAAADADNAAANADAAQTAADQAAADAAAAQAEADIASITTQDAAQAEADAAAADAAVAQAMADQLAADAELAAAEAEIAAITAQDAEDEAAALAEEEAANLAALNAALADINASNQAAAKTAANIAAGVVGQFGIVGTIASLIGRATGFFESFFSSISTGQTGRANADLLNASAEINRASDLVSTANVPLQIKKQVAIVKDNIDQVRSIGTPDKYKFVNVDPGPLTPPPPKMQGGIGTQIVVDATTGKVVSGQIKVDEKGKVVPGQVAIDNKTGKVFEIVQDKVTDQVTLIPGQASATSSLLPVVALAAGYLLFGQ